MTPRQRQTLIAYLSTGSRKEAAIRLGVAPQTVKSHLSGAYASLGVENALEAARLLGWLRVPDHVEWARRRRDEIPRRHRDLLIASAAHRRRLRILGQRFASSGAPTAEREVGAFTSARSATAPRPSRG